MRKKQVDSSVGSPARRQGAVSRSTTPLDGSSFRRNRTLTGSSSAKVVSSNELNAEFRSPRAHVHHLTSLRRRLLGYFTVVALVTFGLYILVSQLVASMTVSVSGTPLVQATDKTAYVKAIESYYAARPVERFRFLLNAEALLSHVQSVRPEVELIELEYGTRPGEAAVTITPRKPIARWSIDGTDQYVDGHGVVFARNYAQDPELEIVDDSGLGSSSNRLVASNRFLGFIGRVIAQAETYGLDIETVTIPTLTTRQVALTLEGQATQYRLSVDRSSGEQVEDISRIRKHMDTNNLKPEYVDVRIVGKAFYR